MKSAKIATHQMTTAPTLPYIPVKHTYTGRKREKGTEGGGGGLKEVA